jgi:hypothetical protein
LGVVGDRAAHRRARSLATRRPRVRPFWPMTGPSRPRRTTGGRANTTSFGMSPPTAITRGQVT